MTLLFRISSNLFTILHRTSKVSIPLLYFFQFTKVIASLTSTITNVLWATNVREDRRFIDTWQDKFVYIFALKKINRKHITSSAHIDLGSTSTNGLKIFSVSTIKIVFNCSDTCVDALLINNKLWRFVSVSSFFSHRFASSFFVLAEKRISVLTDHLKSLLAA